MKVVRKKITLAVLTVACTLMLGLGITLPHTQNAYADTAPALVEGMLTVEQAASIKTSVPNGIKFTARISEGDYTTLKESYTTVDYGMIIAPTDYVNGDGTEMNLDGWTANEKQVVAYTGTAESGVQYFQTSTVAPQKDLEAGGYSFCGNFVGVKDANLDRDFSVRAFITVDAGTATEQTVYSNPYNRSVYSVATAALVKGEVAAAEYCQTLISTVNKKNEAVDYTTVVTNLTEGKNATDEIKMGDTFKVEQTYTNATYGNTITVYPQVIAPEGCIENKLDGTYVRTSANMFKATFTLDGTEEVRSEAYSFTGEPQSETLTAADFATLNTTISTVSDASAEDIVLGTAYNNMTAGKLGDYLPATTGPIYKVDFKANGSYVDKQNTITFQRDKWFDGCYVTFKYFKQNNQHLVFYDGGVVNTFSTTEAYQLQSPKTVSAHYGGVTFTHYDLEGNISEYGKQTAGNWYAIEMYIPTTTFSQDLSLRLQNYYVNSYYGPTNFYMTDITVSNYSICEAWEPAPEVLTAADFATLNTTISTVSDASAEDIVLGTAYNDTPAGKLGDYLPATTGPIYKVDFKANGSYVDTQNTITFQRDKWFDGCYVTFKYFKQNNQHLVFYKDGVVTTFSTATAADYRLESPKTVSAYYGGVTFTHYDLEGNISEYGKQTAGNWYAIEMYISTTTFSQDLSLRLQNYYVNSYGGPTNFYMTDITVSSTSLFAK